MSILLDSIDAHLGAVGRRQEAADQTEWAKARGIHLVSYQRDVLSLVAKHEKVAVPAGNGVGKGWVGALLALSWIERHPPGQARVMVTAPTLRQVTQSIWADMKTIARTAAARGKPLAVDVFETHLKLNGQRVGQAFSAADSAAGGLKSLGAHARYLLVIVDESQGMSESKWSPLRRFLTGAGGKWVSLGNTDRDSGPFYEVCQPDSGWEVRPIPATEAPDISGEDCPPEVRHALTQRSTIEGFAKDYGEDSDRYRAAVKAEFPEQSTRSYFPAQWVRRAMGKFEREGRPRLGVDPAGAGSDDTEIAAHWPKTGRTELVTPSAVRSTADEQIMADGVCAATVTLGAYEIRWDTVGAPGAEAMALAHAALSLLRRGELPDEPDKWPLLRDALAAAAGIIGPVRTVGMNSGAPAENREKYSNRKAEWHAYERTRLQEQSLGLPDDPQCARDFTALQSIPPKAGREAVERKEDLRKRLGRSPDRGDAVLLATVPGLPPARKRKVQGFS